MLSFIILAFFSTQSVALSERSVANLLNPAGLAFSPGYEFSFYGDTANYTLNLLLNNLGLSYEKGGNYYIAEGVALPSNFYLGIGYKISQSSKNALYGGILFRPTNYLSLGFTYWQKNNLQGGIALKPIKDYLTLFFDANYKSDTVNWKAGLSLSPLKGLSAFATYSKDKSLGFGVQLSLGKVLLSGMRDGDKNKGFFVLSTNKYPTFLKEKKVVLLKLTGSYDEMRSEGSLFGAKGVSFFDLVTTLDSLAEEPEVKGIFVVLDNLVLSINQVEELRGVFLKFREKGKKVYFYSENYFLGSYLLAKSGDKVFMNPVGEIFIPGLGSVSLYFKPALEKLGIKPEAQRIGEYKSAVEPFIMDTMSTYNREQLMAYLNTVYEYAKEVIPDFDRILEQSMINGDSALAQKLVDSLIYATDINTVIRNDFGKSVRVVRFEKREPRPVEVSWARPKYKIAYVVAEGSIVEGESSVNPMPIFGGKQLGSATIERVFDRLEKDKNVKAVVLRVDSPGGSGLASEIMWNAIRKTAKKKPVIVSMGSVAGSGGYYISSCGTKVLASRTTLTGSIGVLNIKFVTKGFLEKLGINVESVSIGKHALAFSSYQELDKEAEEALNQEIRWFYQKFLKRVEEGRGLPADSIDKIGRGRIWSGEDALRIGLVDKNGGLLDAIKLAKELSGVRDAEVYYQPTLKPKALLGGMPSLSLETLDQFLSNPIYLELTKPLTVR